MANGTVACPGAFTALVAVARAGFKATYVSGGRPPTRRGCLDIGLLSLTEVCRTIREVADASGLFVIADADTGYGEAEMARGPWSNTSRNGAGLHLEDQVFPKRCGHLDGKTLIPTDHMVEKVEAAVAAKHHPDFIICARTDARSVDGLDAAIERGQAYRDAAPT